MNKFEEVLQPISELLQRKNTDYGNSYDKLRSEYGELAFLIRLEDKLNRAKTLYKQSALVTTESLEDSIKDIIGYCALELVYMAERNHTKPLELGGVVYIPEKCMGCKGKFSPTSRACMNCKSPL